MAYTARRLGCLDCRPGYCVVSLGDACNTWHMYHADHASHTCLSRLARWSLATTSTWRCKLPPTPVCTDPGHCHRHMASRLRTSSQEQLPFRDRGQGGRCSSVDRRRLPRRNRGIPPKQQIEMWASPAVDRPSSHRLGQTLPPHLNPDDLPSLPSYPSPSTPLELLEGVPDERHSPPAVRAHRRIVKPHRHPCTTLANATLAGATWRTWRGHGRPGEDTSSASHWRRPGPGPRVGTRDWDRTLAASCYPLAISRVPGTPQIGISTGSAGECRPSRTPFAARQHPNTPRRRIASPPPQASGALNPPRPTRTGTLQGRPPPSSPSARSGWLVRSKSGAPLR